MEGSGAGGSWGICFHHWLILPGCLSCVLQVRTACPVPTSKHWETTGCAFVHSFICFSIYLFLQLSAGILARENHTFTGLGVPQYPTPSQGAFCRGVNRAWTSGQFAVLQLNTA